MFQNNNDILWYVGHEKDGKGATNKFATYIIDCVKKNMHYKNNLGIRCVFHNLKHDTSKCFT